MQLHTFELSNNKDKRKGYKKPPSKRTQFYIFFSTANVRLYTLLFKVIMLKY